MSDSPFPHHGPLAPEQVSGREAETVELCLRLTDHRPTALLAPRRYGKTSLIRHSVDQLDRAGVATAVAVDLFGVTSYADFAVRLDQALSNVRGRLRHAIDSVAAGLSIRLGIINLELRRRGRGGPDPVAACHSLLEVLTRTAERQATILVLDEFSDITRVDGLGGLLRAHLQPHYATMGVVFAGSKPSMMRELFGARDRPFFSQAEVIELGLLSQEAVTEIVHDGFDRTDRQAGPVAVRVLATARGHPQRTMQLADAAWRRTAQGTEADDGIWADAVGDVRAALDAVFGSLYQQLPPAQGPVLRSVARTGSPFSASEARFHDLSNSSISVARDNLVRDGHLAFHSPPPTDKSGSDPRTPRKVRIVDPLFEDWLARTFP